jgi:hypothetical protein
MYSWPQRAGLSNHRTYQAAPKSPSKESKLEEITNDLFSTIIKNQDAHNTYQTWPVMCNNGQRLSLKAASAGKRTPNEGDDV